MSPTIHNQYLDRYHNYKLQFSEKLAEVLLLQVSQTLSLRNLGQVPSRAVWYDIDTTSIQQYVASESTSRSYSSTMSYARYISKTNHTFMCQCPNVLAFMTTVFKSILGSLSGGLDTDVATLLTVTVDNNPGSKSNCK